MKHPLVPAAAALLLALALALAPSAAQAQLGKSPTGLNGTLAKLFGNPSGGYWATISVESQVNQSTNR